MRKRIGELLCEEELVTPVQVEEALRIQRERGGKIVEILVSLGYIDWPTVEHFLGQTLRTPRILLPNCHIPRDVVRLLPRDMVVKHEAVPIDKMSVLLSVGMTCPLDCEAIRSMADHTGLRVKPLLCSVYDVREAIQRHYSDLSDHPIQ